jgi:hypothetical protein
VELGHRVTSYLLLNFTPARQKGDEEQKSQGKATKKQKKGERTETDKINSRRRGQKITLQRGK